MNPYSQPRNEAITRIAERERAAYIAGRTDEAATLRFIEDHLRYESVDEYRQRRAAEIGRVTRGGQS